MEAGNKKKIREINVMDIEKRRTPSKHYVFVLEITWNDGTQNVIYRRYSHFFTFQTSLIDAFPVEGGVKNPADRVLPFLPGKVLFRSNVREVALKRKTALEEYCKNLIKLPGKILQCEIVTTFFEPTEDDIGSLTNSLTKEGSRKINGKKKADVISDPVVLEQYVAVSDFKKCGKGQISLVAGDVVEVVEKSDNGWFFVSLEDEQGWVPCSYLEPVDGNQEEALVEKEKFVCVKPFKKSMDDEINLELGAIVGVIQKGMDGWWEVRYRGEKGWAPRAHLKNAMHLNLGAQQLNEGIVKDRESLKITDKSGVSVPPRRKTVKRTVVRRMPSGPSGEEHEYVALQDYQLNIGDKKFSLSGGKAYQVIERAPNGWTLIKVGSEQGWVPSDLLNRRRKEEVVFSEDDIYQNVRKLSPAREVEENGREQNNNNPIVPSDIEHYVTIGSYENSDDTGISFKEGVTVQILEKNTTGWWFIKIGAEEGWAPSTYLQKVKKVPVKKSIPSVGGSTTEVLEISLAPPKPDRKSWIAQSYENVDLAKQDVSQSPSQARISPVPKPRSASKTGADEKGSPVSVQELRAAFAGKNLGGPISQRHSVDEKPTGHSAAVKPNLRKISEPHRQPSPSPVNVGGKVSPFVPNRPPTPRSGKSPTPPERPRTSPNRASPGPPRPSSPPKDVYITLSEYRDKDEGMLSFGAGENIKILQKDDGGWWLGMIGVKKGWVPSNFLKKLS
eukprot:gene12333-2983_t